MWFLGVSEVRKEILCKIPLFLGHWFLKLRRCLSLDLGERSRRQQSPEFCISVTWQTGNMYSKSMRSLLSLSPWLLAYVWLEIIESVSVAYSVDIKRSSRVRSLKCVIWRSTEATTSVSWRDHITLSLPRASIQTAGNRGSFQVLSWRSISTRFCRFSSTPRPQSTPGQASRCCISNGLPGKKATVS